MWEEKLKKKHCPSQRLNSQPLIVKQKVDEFSTKALPLSLQRKTAYYCKIEVWMIYVFIMFMQVQEGKNKQKLVIFPQTPCWIL